MAANTNPQLQTQIIYSIYVRNHTPEGTFRAVIPDLDRIRALGTDIIWFLPIHPIGVAGKRERSVARMRTAITEASILLTARWTILKRSCGKFTPGA